MPKTSSKGSGANPLAASLRASKSRKEELEANLVGLQEKLRKNPYDAATRAAVHAAKQEIAVAADEYAELARAHATLAGGKNFSPPAG